MATLRNPWKKAREHSPRAPVEIEVPAPSNPHRFGPIVFWSFFLASTLIAGPLPSQALSGPLSS